MVISETLVNPDGVITSVFKDNVVVRSNVIVNILLFVSGPISDISVPSAKSSALYVVLLFILGNGMCVVPFASESALNIPDVGGCGTLDV